MTRPPRQPVPPAPSTEGSSAGLPDGPDPRRLHEATDRLNEVLLDFQEALAGLKLGVSARVTLDERDDAWHQALTFAKSGGTFKLLIETGYDYDPDSISTTPITSASRETRLHAVEELPKLYEALLAEFEAEIKRVNESIDDVAKLAAALRAKAGR